MKEDILQEMIDGCGEYFIAQRYVSGYGRNNDTWEAMFMSPIVPRELFGKNIMDMPYKEVMHFADQEVVSIIHLGKSYSPFQHGIRNKEIINLKRVTCKPMELIVKCYEEDEKDYYKILEIMESLSTKKETKDE